MTAHSNPHPLRSLIGFAAITAVAGITLGWPQTTYAERDDLTAWVAPGTQVNKTIVAEGRLVRDAKAKSGWAMEIKARNTGDVSRNCDVTAMVLEVDGMPMARVAPPPKTVWRQRESFPVAAHQEVTRRIPVPAPLAHQLDQRTPAPAVAQQEPDPFSDTDAKSAAPRKSAAPQKRTQAKRAVPPLPDAIAFSSLSVRLLPAG